MPDTSAEYMRIEAERVGISDVDLTENGVAELFTRQFHDHLRYCHHTQEWYVWAGSYWKREQTKLAFSFARRICQRAAGLATEKERPRISKAAFAAAVERFAQSDRAHAVTAEIWDADPWLLGTPGGVVDLRTGILSDANPDDHITKVTAVTPAERGTPHPVWSQFLDEATGGDKEYQAFLQRLCGYWLTGDVTEEMLSFFYGSGGNGKGVLLNAVTTLMGGYSVQVPIEAFTANSRLPMEYYRAQMHGARLVTASETEQGSVWAESQIKELTGNEAPVNARHPYGKPFTYEPKFKIGLVGNHAPRLKGRTPAMERRLRVCPFNHRPPNPDHTLKERLRPEYPAILRWMIEGCLQWQRERLGTCAAVVAETQGYFEQQDVLGQWVEERCILDRSLTSKPGTLLADFNAWAKSAGSEAASRNDFSESLERIGNITRHRAHGVRYLKGIGLKAADEQGNWG